MKTPPGRGPGASDVFDVIRRAGATGGSQASLASSKSDGESFSFRGGPHRTGPFRHSGPAGSRNTFRGMTLASGTSPARNQPALGHSITHPPSDILVFEKTEAGITLVGGNGRGAGWAGIVEVPDSEQTLVREAWSVGTPVRMTSRRPRQVVCPYHARAAAAVPVGDRQVVVVGANRRLDMSDSDIVRLAVAAVDRAHGVPADKLLADELELVQALRALMAYQA